MLDNDVAVVTWELSAPAAYELARKLKGTLKVWEATQATVPAGLMGIAAGPASIEGCHLVWSTNQGMNIPAFRSLRKLSP
jgi:hypothetical protein